jgi:hypothetical protein
VVGNFEFSHPPTHSWSMCAICIHCLFNTSTWSLQAFIRGVEGATVFQQLPGFLHE